MLDLSRKASADLKLTGESLGFSRYISFLLAFHSPSSMCDAAKTAPAAASFLAFLGRQGVVEPASTQTLRRSARFELIIIYQSMNSCNYSALKADERQLNLLRVAAKEKDVGLIQRIWERKTKVLESVKSVRWVNNPPD